MSQEMSERLVSIWTRPSSAEVLSEQRMPRHEPSRRAEALQYRVLDRGGW